MATDTTTASRILLTRRLTGSASTPTGLLPVVLPGCPMASTCNGHHPLESCWEPRRWERTGLLTTGSRVLSNGRRFPSARTSCILTTAMSAVLLLTACESHQPTIGNGQTPLDHLCGAAIQSGPSNVIVVTPRTPITPEIVRKWTGVPMLSLIHISEPTRRTP